MDCCLVAAYEGGLDIGCTIRGVIGYMAEPCTGDVPLVTSRRVSYQALVGLHDRRSLHIAFCTDNYFYCHTLKINVFLWMV
jgi:hypothetical protein